MTDERCRVCGTSSNLIRQECPSESGPGWYEFVCALCIALPADPDTVSDRMTALLMKLAGVDR